MRGAQHPRPQLSFAGPLCVYVRTSVVGTLYFGGDGRVVGAFLRAVLKMRLIVVPDRRVRISGAVLWWN